MQGTLTAVVAWLVVFLVVYCPAARADVSKDLVLVVENSSSMKEHDPGIRLPSALRDLVDALDGNIRVGIVIFHQGVELVAPLTAFAQEHGQLAAGLGRIDYQGGGARSDLAAAIERAIYELRVSGRRDADRLIVLIFDGGVSTGNTSLDLDKAKWVREDLAAEAASQRIKVYGVGLTEQADFYLIEPLSRKTGGTYFRAQSAETIAPALLQIKSAITSAGTGDYRSDVSRSEPLAGEGEGKAVPGVPKLAKNPATEPRLDAAAARTPRAGGERDLGGGPLVAGRGAGDGSVAPRWGIWALLLMGAGVFGLTRFIIIPVLRAKKLAPNTVPIFGTEHSPVVGGLLRDLSGITGVGSLVIGRKATMFGRVVGTDTDHVNYIVVNHSTVGRRHAIIEYKDGAFWIIDQGSVNGTFVNHERIFGERRLRHGDRIGVHTYEFEFTVPDTADTGELTAKPGTEGGSEVAGSAPEASIGAGADHPGNGGLGEQVGPHLSEAATRVNRGAPNG